MYVGQAKKIVFKFANSFFVGVIPSNWLQIIVHGDVHFIRSFSAHRNRAINAHQKV